MDKLELRLNTKNDYGIYLDVIINEKNLLESLLNDEAKNLYRSIGGYEALYDEDFKESPEYYMEYIHRFINSKVVPNNEHIIENFIDFARGSDCYYNGKKDDSLGRAVSLYQKIVPKNNEDPLEYDKHEIKFYVNALGDEYVTFVRSGRDGYIFSKEKVHDELEKIGILIKENTSVRAEWELLKSKIAYEIIDILKEMPSGNAPEDLGLDGMIWQEYAYQIQTEESFMFDVYLLEIERAYNGVVEDLSEHDKALVEFIDLFTINIFTGYEDIEDYKYAFNDVLRVIDIIAEDEFLGIDEDGNRIDEDGNYLDDNGNRIDEYGNHINKDGVYVDEDGNPLPVDENGETIFLDEYGDRVTVEGDPYYDEKEAYEEDNNTDIPDEEEENGQMKLF